MKLTLVGLDRILPRARCHRVVKAGSVTLTVTSDDPSRTLGFELTREDLDEIEVELRGDVPTVVTGDATEIEGVPGSVTTEYRAG